MMPTHLKIKCWLLIREAQLAMLAGEIQKAQERLAEAQVLLMNERRFEQEAS